MPITVDSKVSHLLFCFCLFPLETDDSNANTNKQTRSLKEFETMAKTEGNEPKRNVVRKRKREEKPINA